MAKTRSPRFWSDDRHLPHTINGVHPQIDPFRRESPDRCRFNAASGIAPRLSAGPSVGNDFALDQIEQMRQHRAAGGMTQARVEPDIKPIDHLVDGADPDP